MPIPKSVAAIIKRWDEIAEMTDDGDIDDRETWCPTDAELFPEGLPWEKPSRKKPPKK